MVLILMINKKVIQTKSESTTNKKDMKSNKIDSPNEGDCIMMSLFKPPVKKKRKKLNYGAANVV